MLLSLRRAGAAFTARAVLSLASAGVLFACNGVIDQPAIPEGSGGVVGATGSTSALECNGEPTVGRGTLRRLTRAEYTRSVRTALGVDTAVAESFSPDERIGGVFVSNRDVPVAGVQLRQYLEAAEEIAEGLDIEALSPCDIDELGEEPCARTFVERVGRRLYRRPLDEEELSRFMAAYRELRADDDHVSALRVLSQSALQSPHFVYHVELDDPDAPLLPNGITRLPAFAVAARLSFLLWGSGPDDELLDAASAGELDDAAGVAAAATRLLDDARSAEAIAEFHGEWLGLNKLDEATRDPTLFPEFGPELLASVRAEAAAFSDYIVREIDGDLAALLTSPVSFPSGVGLALMSSEEGRDVGDGLFELDSEKRGGLLTQPAFLMAHAHADQTSPILRGRALRERLFCQPLADPPANLVIEPPPLDPSLTTRERYAAHRTAGGACVGCHRMIDDLGFALEHYDALGRYRETENDKPIDSTGLLEGTDIDGELDGARVLAARMSESIQVQDCYGQQWFRYALGRPEQTEDGCSLQALQQALRDGRSIREALLELVTTHSFLYQTVDR